MFPYGLKTQGQKKKSETSAATSPADRESAQLTFTVLMQL